MNFSYNFDIWILFILFQVINCCDNSALPSTLDRKRKTPPSSDEIKSSPTPHNMIKKRILFWSVPLPSMPAIDYNFNPPNLFLCCGSLSERSKLPQNLFRFVEIFAEYHAANQNNFDKASKDYELIKWEESDVVSGVSQHVHYEFITQFINRFNRSDLPILKQYIAFFFRRYSISDFDYFKLLLAATGRMNHSCVAALLKYVPANGLCQNWVAVLWNQILPNFVKYYSISSTGTIFEIQEIIYLLTKHLGSVISTNFDSLSYLDSAVLDEFLRIYPVITGLICFDPSLIEAFNEPFDLKFLMGTVSGYIYFSWKDLILSLSKDRIEATADALFRLLSKQPQVTLKWILQQNRRHLSEFLLIYSKEAKRSVSKEEAIELIRLAINKSDNLRFLDALIVIYSFSDLKLKDLEDKIKGSPLAGFVRLILRTVESFYDNEGRSIFTEFLESNPSKSMDYDDLDDEEEFIVVWTPPAVKILSEGSAQDDLENSFLYEAGRMILARHFGVPYSFTNYHLFKDDQSCFKELAWLIEYHVNYTLHRKYGKALKIRLNIL